jgi:hypothetical protein
MLGRYQKGAWGSSDPAGCRAAPVGRLVNSAAPLTAHIRFSRRYLRKIRQMATCSEAMAAVASDAAREGVQGIAGNPYQKWRIPLMSMKAARRTSPKSVASCSETANSPG